MKNPILQHIPEKNYHEVHIMQGQVLENLFPNGIETNTILDKTVPGCGATTCEINMPRHSIIIEPNVPVIIGKEEKNAQHKNPILGIREGVYYKDIIEYLNNDAIPFKKLMVTPESYGRLKAPIEDAKMDLFNDFWLVIDECDRVIQDSDYRPSIAAPFYDFFKFKNKYLVSATPLVPRLNGFKGDRFQFIKIIPDYDYRPDMDLIRTNEIMGAIKETIANTKNKVAFFINQTDLIISCIKSLGLEKNYHVYCGEGSVDKLIEDNKLTNVSVNFNKLAEYTFFTSRFFSAVDLDTEEKPDIIMVTDCTSYPYTIIDPFTSAIQISGRFRNGVNRITHITNTNSKYQPREEKTIREFLRDQIGAFNVLNTFEEITSTEGGRALLEEIKEKLSITKFLTNEGKANGFLIENYLYTEKVNSYYYSLERLMEAYNNANYFCITQIDKTFASVQVKGAKRKPGITLEQRRENAISLRNFEAEKMKIDFSGERDRGIRRIKEEDPFTYEFYMLSGYDEMVELRFDKARMETRLQQLKNKDKKQQIPILNEIYTVFDIGEVYTAEDTKTMLQPIYDRHGIKEKATKTKLVQYFTLELNPETGKPKEINVTRENGKRVKGNRITGRKYEITE